MNQIYEEIPIGIFDNRPVIYRRYKGYFREISNIFGYDYLLDKYATYWVK